MQEAGDRAESFCSFGACSMVASRPFWLVAASRIKVVVLGTRNDGRMIFCTWARVLYLFSSPRDGIHHPHNPRSTSRSGEFVTGVIGKSSMSIATEFTLPGKTGAGTSPHGILATGDRLASGVPGAAMLPKPWWALNRA